jgi:hypothetical protein
MALSKTSSGRSISENDLVEHASKEVWVVSSFGASTEAIVGICWTMLVRGASLAADWVSLELGVSVLDSKDCELWKFFAAYPTEASRDAHRTLTSSILKNDSATLEFDLQGVKLDLPPSKSFVDYFIRSLIGQSIRLYLCSHQQK